MPVNSQDQSSQPKSRDNGGGFPPQRQPTKIAAPETRVRKPGNPRGSRQPAREKSPSTKERRRTQVRLAQRAYRARNDANIAALKSRIATLESALEQMGEAIVSFSDVLIESEVIKSHPAIADPLRETVKTCLDLAKHGEEECHDTQSPETTPEVHEQIHNRALRDSHFPTQSPESIYMADHTSRAFPFGLEGVTMIEVPEFVDHVRTVCLYRGFVMLKDPSVPLDALKRPFRFLLPLVPRETITSFFYARLHARLRSEQPPDFDEIPFFQLGGAGSHYPELLMSDQGNTQPQRSGKCPVIQGALPTISPEAYEELNGEWFDIRDLEGYLRRRGISLSMRPPSETREPSSIQTVNAVCFSAALLSKVICLGQSPGFKRSDVERAISSSSWT